MQGCRMIAQENRIPKDIEAQHKPMEEKAMTDV